MKHILFDLDDTLIDFRLAENAALPHLFEAYGLPLNDDVYDKYQQGVKNLWERLKQGEITRNELQSKRFQDTFSYFGYDVNGEKMDREFREMLANHVHVFPQAYEVLEALSKKYTLHIVTNGAVATQSKKIETTGLQHFFKEVFISRATGYQKPDKEFFDHVLSTIQATPDECCIIGDSLHADILGGNQAGITTVWHNRYHFSNPTSIKPTYEIHQLRELLTIL